MTLEDDVREAWRHAAEGFEPLGAPRTSEVQIQLWLACVETLRTTFAAHLGSVPVEQRFTVPPEYAIFMQIFGGGWQRRAGLGLTLFSAPMVAGATASDFQQFYAETEEPDGPQDDGLWLRIGYWSDKHDFLLCCDQTHRSYGVVLDGHDSHPWLNGVNFAGCIVVGSTFLDFLRSLARARHG